MVEIGLHWYGWNGDKEPKRIITPKNKMTPKNCNFEGTGQL